MWPILLDMTKEESMQHLRCLEIDAFSGLVSALRAQGTLDNDKLKILKDTGAILHISQERHKAEIRRVVNDEKLSTIAYHVNGEKHSGGEWAEEGQRLIPLMARVAPQTAYSAIADEVADTASKINKQLPNPACTERKRPPPISPTHLNASTSDQGGKSMQFRMNDTNKMDEIKKRKLSMDNPMPSHLMGPPKFSRIQQIYRQRTKVKQQKEQQPVTKIKQEVEKPEYVHVQQHQVAAVAKPMQQLMSHPTPKVQPKLPVNSISPSAPLLHCPKINILQNISFQASSPSTIEDVKPEISIPATGSNEIEIKDQQANAGTSSIIETSQVPKLINKLITNASINKANQVTIKAGNSELTKTIKVCAPRKTISSKTVTTSSGQKLIVVSNPQTLSTSSILQRTLTIPFKNISVKNFDKFKIVTTSCNSTQSNTKQKVVTVRTTPNKKMIPFSQVQVLNTKGGIKVLPLPPGGKIISSKSIANTPNIYAMNTAETAACGTKSITSTPVLMSCKTQDNQTAIHLEDINYSIPKIETVTNASQADDTSTNISETIHLNAEDDKSSILADVIEKSGLNMSAYTDFEHQITEHHLTVPSSHHNNIDHANDAFCKVEPISQNDECLDAEDDIEEHVIMDTSEEYSMQNIEGDIKIENDVDSYIILDGEHDHEATEEILLDGMEVDQPMEVLNIVGSLDPITGQYSITDNDEQDHADHVTVIESHNLLEIETSEEVHLNTLN